MVTKNPVRLDSKKVVNNANHVSINQDKIPELVEHIIDNYELNFAQWNAPVFPSESNYDFDTIVDFFVIGNSLNYCFNDLNTGVKYKTRYIGTEWKGAFGLWASLKRAIDNDIPICNSEYLQNLSINELKNIFDATDNTKMPMLKSRLDNLHNVGEKMSDIGGSFGKLFYDDVKLYGVNGVVEQFSNMNAFKDERTYNGEKIRFDKRAQLTVSMLYGKFKDTEYEFDIIDIDSFTIFADYGIPAGLAVHNVLEYSDSIINAIKTNTIIPENSEEEVEIRASTVIAGEYIQSEIKNQTGNNINMVVLDYVLWKMRNDADTNVHITKTTSY